MHIPTNLFLPIVLMTLASTTPSSSFLLKTHSSDASKDNLYLAAYHITPGVNDAVLESDKTHAIAASLNDTAIVYPSGPGVAYGLNLIREAYTQWSKVQITPGVTKGYVVLPNGTLTNTEFPGFGGWLACDWSHYNTTQLFWKLSYLFKEASVNCKEVELVVE